MPTRQFTLKWDDELGPMWMNPDNLQTCLDTDTHCAPGLCEVVEMIPAPDRPLPPENRLPENLAEMEGVFVDAGYEVLSWSPEPDGKGTITQVHMSMKMEIGEVTVRPTVRLKSKRAVTEMIRVLERHREHLIA